VDGDSDDAEDEAGDKKKRLGGFPAIESVKEFSFLETVKLRACCRRISFVVTR